MPLAPFAFALKKNGLRLEGKENSVFRETHVPL